MSHPHDHDHGHDHPHDDHHHHGHPLNPRHLLRPHSHDAADQVDAAMEATGAGMRALWVSAAALGATALVQAVVVAMSGSVALLGDTLHNAMDAMTVVPLAIAFVAGRRPPKAGWLRTDAHRPPAAANRARPGKGWLRKSKRPRANWYSSGPSTRWVRRSRSKDRWRTRRRSLSGALLSGVRDLLPSGDRR